MSLILFLGACSQKPEPLIKEQVQSSSKEDYEYLKETSKAAPLEIDLYKAIAIAIKNNRDLRIQIMDSALNQGQTDVVKFDMLPKLSANAGYKVLEKHPASTSGSMVTEKEKILCTKTKRSLLEKILRQSCLKTYLMIFLPGMIGEDT